jgi:ABC-type multidrug transport system ATPase subunit
MFLIKNIIKSFIIKRNIYSSLLPLFKKRITVIKKINLKIKNSHCFIGIIGDNGSGKSTLLSLLSGFTLPDQGDIIFKYKRYKYKNKELRRIGYLCHDKLFKNMDKNFYYNIYFLKKMFNLKIKKSDPFYNYLKKCFNINYKKFSCNMSKFSKGMLQKFNLIKTLLLEKIINCFDEPLQGLDEGSVNQFINIINFKKKVINLDKKHYSVFFFTSHSKKFLYSICDHFVVLKNGKMINYLRKSDLNNSVIMVFKVFDEFKLLLIRNILENLLKDLGFINYKIINRKNSNGIFIDCYIYEFDKFYTLYDLNDLVLKMLSFNIIKLFKLEYNFIN